MMRVPRETKLIYYSTIFVNSFFTLKTYSLIFKQSNLNQNTISNSCSFFNHKSSIVICANKTIKTKE